MENPPQCLELDELYWFIERKSKTETRENVYIMTAVSRNLRNKNDTFTVEGVNADLRHYIPILARRSRCFPRKLETLRAVVEVFADAYNRFGVAKMMFRQKRDPISRELPFSVLDFL